MATRPPPPRPGTCVAFDDPRSKRTVRKWVNKLMQYNLVEAHGQGPNRTYETIESFGSET